MSIYVSKLWISDLDKIIVSLPELHELSGKSIMITGCTGLICSAVVDVLIRWNETHRGKIKILAAGRSENKVAARFNPYGKEDWFTFVLYDASSTENDLYLPCDYIIHGASNASPNKIVKEPVETMIKHAGMWFYAEPPDYYAMAPEEAGDVAGFVEMILTHTEEEMRAEMEGYDILLIKYNALIDAVKDACGVDLQALGNANVAKFGSLVAGDGAGDDQTEGSGDVQTGEGATE